MTPDFERAALMATECLITHHITTGPIDPLPVLKTMPGVLVLSFAEMALQMELDRNNLLHSFSPENHDAMLCGKEINGRMMYFVVFNQRLPLYLIQRGLARELGHIVLGHDGSRPLEVRAAEAQVFAYHFLCPRALIHAVLEESGVPLTTEVLGTMTGCFERCLSGMRRTPGVHVPPELNHLVREQFAEYLGNLFDYLAIVAPTDESRIADFGTYMDGYEE